jgi:tetratricopeptide (TPR) repeat protein
MRRVSLLSLGSAAICKTSIAVAGDCSQDEEPQLAIGVCSVVIVASQATAATDLFRADAVRAAGDFAAIAHHTMAMEIDQDNAKPYIARGNAYWDARNFKKAMADYSRAIALQTKDGAAYNNRAWVYYSPGNPVRALQERGKPFNFGRSGPMCSIRERMFWRFPGGAQTPFRPIEALCALIPTLKEAKKVLGDWVQRPNIQMRPAKLIWNKYSRPLAWQG